MNFELVCVADRDTIVVSDSLGEKCIRFRGIDAPGRDQLAGVETINIVPVDRDR